MIEKQLSLFLDNKPGVLAEVCKTLSEQGINIRGLSVSDTVDHAMVRMIVSDPDKALHILGEHNTVVVEDHVLAVELSDKPGALGQIAQKLARGKVNISYAYGTSDGPNALIFIRVDDPKKGEQLLSGAKPKKKVRR
jgi:hypothetical protein